MAGVTDDPSGAVFQASPIASPGASPVASPVTPAGPSTQIIVGKITIELTDAGFVPAHFESAVGRDVTISLVNTGGRLHNFTLDAFDISIDLAPGGTNSVEILAPSLGEYRYFSDVSGDEVMSGTMTVFI